MGKKEDGTELEGLMAEDGSQPVDKGLTLVEYNRRNPSTIPYTGMSPRCFKVRVARKTVPKKNQILQDRKRESVAVLEKTKKTSSVSTKAGKKGGKRN